MDEYISERSLVAAGEVDNAINLLKEKKLIYEGVLQPPKGKQSDDWEPRPQLLFKSTDFGDDVIEQSKNLTGLGRTLLPTSHIILTNRTWISQNDRCMGR